MLLSKQLQLQLQLHFLMLLRPRSQEATVVDREGRGASTAASMEQRNTVMGSKEVATTTTKTGATSPRNRVDRESARLGRRLLSPHPPSQRPLPRWLLSRHPPFLHHPSQHHRSRCLLSRRPLCRPTPSRLTLPLHERWIDKSHSTLNGPVRCND